ncbi:hypothetical protein JRQ81_007727 [Phrynocephalus forsythii]|uniref:MIR domain-containing protein n=1 Tax=Phrynocephalus forsythii TaxID=171643 RepID=A0A9Q1AT01_9SAUR|nr:hypothetical protein JRQ81_007727 [Phrynocephalus forsythii]
MRPDGASLPGAFPRRWPWRPRLLLLLPSLLLLSGPCGAQATEAGAVTCGSVLKLLNTRHNVRLHSHEVKYGSGSGQQSVTGVEASDDANSYWRIRGKTDGSCQRGMPIKCGQTLRLTHVNTGKNLHTHHFPSPLSNNQGSMERNPSTEYREDPEKLSFRTTTKQRDQRTPSASSLLSVHAHQQEYPAIMFPHSEINTEDGLPERQIQPVNSGSCSPKPHRFTRLLSVEVS